ncbi:bacterio-opsin activator domain-containing protein [Halorubrum sp. HHNYT27]|uniref:bacterio-opsin activator domain-containing protein n=1 Tax=Halorubrum sp. HHNYT27 TaxID=3402275 RepID=UPI003EBE235A
MSQGEDPFETSTDLTGPTYRAAVGRFLDQADLGFLYADGTHEVVDSNTTADALLDVDGGVVGADPREFDPGFGPELVAAIEAAVRDDRIAEREATLDDGTALKFRAVPGRDGVGVLVYDATHDVGLRRDLRRSNRILETLEDGVYTLDEALVITSVNEAVTTMTGYDREELVGSHASMLAGSDTLDKAEEILAMLRGDGSDIGMIESSITTADGESLPIETHFSPVEFDDGRRGRVGILRDVTYRRRNENALRELSRSARRLLRADDADSVFETAVDVITGVWPETTVVAYSFDRTEAVLIPTAASGGDHDECGPGSVVWEAFTTGADDAETTDDPARMPSRRIDGSAEGGPSDDSVDDSTVTAPTGRVIERSVGSEGSSFRTLYATLDGYGLLRIDFDSAEPAGNVEEPIGLLAANAVAALDSVERESTLSRNRERLERLHGLNTVLRRINGELVDSETLDQVATAVCDTLIEADQVGFVWMGETYRTGGDPTPIAWAGDSEGLLDLLPDGEVAPPRTADGGRPVDAAGLPGLRAVETGEPVRVSDVSNGLRQERWRECALSRGHRSVVAVPLSYDGLCYGVLSVYADRGSVFDGEFGDLLVELGDNIANAINGLETKRSLRTESLVELEVRLDGTDALLSRIASAFGEPLHVNGTVPQGGDRSVVYFTTDGDGADVMDSVPAVESLRETGDGATDRIEATVIGETVADKVSAHGGSVERLVASETDLVVTMTFPRSVDVRRLMDYFREQYGGAELRSRRDRSAGAPPEAPVDLSDDLTERQREAVETAYLGGYFEWPRASTGEEIATAMDITQPTFNRHLRTAERKLLDRLFDDAEE